MTKTYVGIDCGKRILDVVRLYENLKPEFAKFKTNHAGIEALLKWLKSEDLITLEAGNQAFRIARTILKNGLNVFVLNPGDIALIYQSLKKTDREDCLKLARLIQRIPKTELPVVEIPSVKMEQNRRICTEDEFWITQRTQLKNRLHSLFTHVGLTEITKKHLDSKNNRDEVISLIPKEYQNEAKRLKTAIDEIDKNLEDLNSEIKNAVQEEKGYAQLITSMPGIGLKTAFAIQSYLGNCSRFSSASQVSFYVGLVPRIDISGDSLRYGRISSRGCHSIRRLIVQSAFALTKSKYSGDLGKFYEKLKVRKGSGKAVIALSRKMIEVLYHMITNGEFYRDIPQEYLYTKQRKLGLI